MVVNYDEEPKNVFEDLIPITKEMSTNDIIEYLWKKPEGKKGFYTLCKKKDDKTESYERIVFIMERVYKKPNLEWVIIKSPVFEETIRNGHGVVTLQHSSGLISNYESSEEILSGLDLSDESVLFASTVKDGKIVILKDKEIK